MLSESSLISGAQNSPRRVWSISAPSKHFAHTCLIEGSHASFATLSVSCLGSPIMCNINDNGVIWALALLCAGDMSGGRWGPFWDKLVFSKIRERVGGEVKYMTTGRIWAGPRLLWCKAGQVTNATLVSLSDVTVLISALC